MRILGWLVVFALVVSSSACKKDHCKDGKHNKDESGVDCGGLDCEPCVSCFDKVQNQGETGVDCGGPCKACELSWKVVNSDGSNLTAVDFNAGLAIAVGEKGTILKSLDSGKTWSSIVSNTTENLTSVHVLDASHFYISGTNDVVLISTDGKSVNQNGTGESLAWKDIHFINATTGSVCGDKMNIYLTSDGGKTWKESYRKFSNETLQAMHFLNQDEAYAIGGYELLHTLDGGKTWTPEPGFQRKSDFSNYSDLFFRTTKDAYTLAEQGMFLFIPLASDGEKWVNKQIRVSNGRMDFLNATGLYAGQNDGKSQGKVLISFDGGYDWKEQAVNKDIKYTDGCVLTSDLMLVVGQNGTILRRAK